MKSFPALKNSAGDFKTTVLSLLAGRSSLEAPHVSFWLWTLRIARRQPPHCCRPQASDANHWPQSRAPAFS